jgi:hypothetical protein
MKIARRMYLNIGKANNPFGQFTDEQFADLLYSLPDIHSKPHVETHVGEWEGQREETFVVDLIHYDDDASSRTESYYKFISTLLSFTTQDAIGVISFDGRVDESAGYVERVWLNGAELREYYFSSPRLFWHYGVEQKYEFNNEFFIMPSTITDVEREAHQRTLNLK